MIEAAPDISAVLVARNSGPDLERSIQSVIDEASRAGISEEVIVVDNASHDGSTEILERQFPGLTVLKNTSNLGFGAAANQGVRAARAERVLLINPDAHLLEGSLQRLNRALDHEPDAALVAPALLLDDGQLQESPRLFYNLKSLLARRTPFGRTTAGRTALEEHAPSAPHEGGVCDVDWVTGAAMLLRRTAMPANGPFDERYFLYFEDVDLCRRLKAAGHRVLFDPDALVAHGFGAASRRQVPWNPLLWQHALSGLLYLQRWNPRWWTLRSIRTLVRGAGRSLLRGLLLLAIGLLLLPSLNHALAASVLGALLIPLHARPAIGRRPLPSVYSLATFLAASSLCAALLTEGVISPELLPTLGLWCLAALPSLRLLDRLLRFLNGRFSRLGFGHRACLLAGSVGAAEKVARSLKEQPEEGLHVVGFVPIEGEGEGGPTPRLSNWRDIAKHAERLRVDSVLLCGSPEQLSRMTGGVVELRRQGVDPAFILTGADQLLQSDAPPELAGRALLPLGTGLGSQLGRQFARIAEWSLAAIGLLLLTPVAPLLLLASVLVSRSSPLLPTERVGLGMRTFQMLRLRSGPGPLGDEGGGWLGELLRLAHADELPQLVNVLRGEMALVGPRPVAVETANSLDEWERARFAVRPGITGVWQLDRLRRWRLEQMVASDLLYVLRRSPSMDLRVLVQTIIGRRNP